MPASDYLEGKVLNDIFGITAFTIPANLYVALYTASPTDADTGTEVPFTNAYARVLVANTTASWLLTGNVITNKNVLTFPTPTPAAWGTVTHWGLRDATTAGNLLHWGALTQQIQTQVGSAPLCAVGALSITLD